MAKFYFNPPKTCLKAIQNGDKSVCSRLGQLLVMKFLVAEMRKPYEIYRKMCDVYRKMCDVYKKMCEQKNV